MKVTTHQSRPRGWPVALLAFAFLWMGCATTQPGAGGRSKEPGGSSRKEAPFKQDTVNPYPAVVVNRGINLRDGPGTAYRVVSRLSGGEQVTVVAVSGEWVRIRVDHDKRVGWVHKVLVRKRKT